MFDAGSHRWRQLRQNALLETDPAKLLPQIADARSVIVVRIEDSKSKDQAAPRDALSALVAALKKLASNGSQVFPFKGYSTGLIRLWPTPK